MRVLSEVPFALKGRGEQGSIPIECQCGEMLMAPPWAGLTVTCPTCKAVETFTSFKVS